MLKNLFSKTPAWFQGELKRFNYGRKIRGGTFNAGEPEFDELESFIEKGDWVIDVGANVGHYTIKMSELVGAEGRVIAFEPIPTTFNLLSANSQHSKYANITLVNAAASDGTSSVGMAIPNFRNGLKNFYEAAIVDNGKAGSSDTHVLTFSIDGLNLGHPIKLIKIDAEGHEPSVFRGLTELLKRDRPILIVETVDQEIRDQLNQLGYIEEKRDHSPNVLFRSRS